MCIHIGACVTFFRLKVGMQTSIGNANMPPLSFPVPVLSYSTPASVARPECTYTHVHRTHPLPRPSIGRDVEGDGVSRVRPLPHRPVVVLVGKTFFPLFLVFVCFCFLNEPILPKTVYIRVYMYNNKYIYTLFVHLSLLFGTRSHDFPTTQYEK